MNDYPTRHTMIKDARSDAPHEVRHLLIHPVKGQDNEVLTKLLSGEQSEIARGKHYEMEQKADTVMQEWAKEGFRVQGQHDPAYEDLKSTVTLAILMGYKVVYDPTYVDMRKNLTGEVSLARWPGRTAKNGGNYQYAFTGTTILASPTLPPGHEINIAPGSKEFIEALQRMAKLQNSVGPFAELVLG